MLDAVNVCSTLNSNQFQIVRRNGFPFRVLHFHSKGLSGAFVQNLKTFLPAGEEITFSHWRKATMTGNNSRPFGVREYSW
jgi:hypothetical protein